MGVTGLTPTLYTSSLRSSFSLSPPEPYNCRFNSSFLYCNRNVLKSSQWRSKRQFVRISGSSSTLKDYINDDATRESNTDIWADSECVEVIAIGNRVDPVLDFCLRSPAHSQSLRFWNIISSGSVRGLLQQKSLGKEVHPNIVGAPVNEESYLKAIVLVASAGYGDDCVKATDILWAIKSGGGLAVAVIMKPFSFEGKRRSDEVTSLVHRLQNCVNFCINIDIDTLLKMDMVTLDEALKTAHRAVSSAINAVSILVSDNHKKHIHSLHGGVRQIVVAEVIEVLKSYKEGKVGFGFGHNVETSIVQAVYDCPFLSMGLKDLDGTVICILSSSCALGDNDVRALICTFRQATACTKDVILSVVYDPDMKPNLIATTVITVCVAEKSSSQKTSLLSRLVDSIPFVFNFLRRNHMQSENPKGSNLRENVFPAILANFVETNEVPHTVPAEVTDENIGILSAKESLLVEDSSENACRDYGDDTTYGFEWLEANGDVSKYIQQNVEGSKASERETLISRNFGLGSRIAQDLSVEDVNSSAGVSVADSPKIFILPVGVRLSDDLHETFDGSNPRQPADRVTPEDAPMHVVVPSVSPLNGVADTGLDVVTEFWNSASTLLRRQHDFSKKQGVVAARAASMLEAERNAKTRWSPVVEIRYRGGIYKGRCQGGLPEGRGSLTFQDGSVYDGMWRYGKRSGIGSLFFSNGDVFHGSWRDDLVHGKGWLYFHSGERWFANFWKGKANGEARFYSKSGEIFFGQFEDGWRHGHFLCIKVDGARYVEIWNEGVLVSSEELDS